jgi:hypothetical protein
MISGYDDTDTETTTEKLLRDIRRNTGNIGDEFETAKILKALDLIAHNQVMMSDHLRAAVSSLIGGMALVALACLYLRHLF